MQNIVAKGISLVETNLSLAIKSSGVIADHARAAVAGGNPRSKVFAIGFNKMGTSSLHDIFNEVGYHSFHGEKWRASNATLIHHSFNAFCDGIPEDFTVLDKRFPHSKFILQVRELDRWISSRIEHILRRPVDRTSAITEDWTLEDSSICNWILDRNKHHLAVLNYFSSRPDDLLVTNFIQEPDAAARICQFLGVSQIARKPHANANKSAGIHELKHEEQIFRCFNSLGVDKSEYSSDLLCRSLLENPDECPYPSNTSQLKHPG